MAKRYTTITDALMVFANSGVSEFTENDEKRAAVIRDMYDNNKTFEQAVADVLNLDATDRRNIGVE